MKILTMFNQFTMYIATKIMLSGGTTALQFLTDGFDVLQKIVGAVGIGFLIFGFIHLMEGYSEQNPSAKTKGFAGAIGGAGIVLIAWQLIPKIPGLFQ